MNVRLSEGYWDHQGAPGGIVVAWVRGMEAQDETLAKASARRAVEEAYPTATRIRASGYANEFSFGEWKVSYWVELPRPSAVPQ